MDISVCGGVSECKKKKIRIHFRYTLNVSKSSGTCLCESVPDAVIQLAGLTGHITDRKAALAYTDGVRNLIQWGK